MSDSGKILGAVASGGALVSGFVLVTFGACATYCGNDLSGGGRGAAGDNNGSGILLGGLVMSVGLIALVVGALALLLGACLTVLLIRRKRAHPGNPPHRQ